MEKNQVERWIQKARASWWEDGLVEIFAGLGLLLIASTGILREHTSGTAQILWNLTWMVVLLGFTFGGQFFLRWLKRRFIWPRTGYAHPETAKIHLRSVLALLLIVGVFVALFLSPNLLLTKILSGAFVFLILFWTYTYSKVLRFLGYAILALLGGGLLTPVQVSLNDFVMALLGLVALPMLIAGILQFQRYRRLAKQWEAQSHE